MEPCGCAAAHHAQLHTLQSGGRRGARCTPAVQPCGCAAADAHRMTLHSGRLGCWGARCRAQQAAPCECAAVHAELRAPHPLYLSAQHAQHSRPTPFPSIAHHHTLHSFRCTPPHTPLLRCTPPHTPRYCTPPHTPRYCTPPHSPHHSLHTTTHSPLLHSTTLPAPFVAHHHTLHSACSIPQENYFLDDGAYGALKIVIEMVRRRLEGQGDIADLLQELRCALHTLVSVVLMIC